jgi:hypothetical protein
LPKIYKKSGYTPRQYYVICYQIINNNIEVDQYPTSSLARPASAQSHLDCPMTKNIGTRILMNACGSGTR